MNVPQDGQKIAVVLHCLAFVTAFKQRAASLIAAVVAKNVPGAQSSHDLVDGLAFLAFPQQQVQVVRHEAVRKQLETAQVFVLTQAFQEGPAVLFIMKNPLIVGTACYNVIDAGSAAFSGPLGISVRRL